MEIVIEVLGEAFLAMISGLAVVGMFAYVLNVASSF